MRAGGARVGSTWVDSKLALKKSLTATLTCAPRVEVYSHSSPSTPLYPSFGFGFIFGASQQRLPSEPDALQGQEAVLLRVGERLPAAAASASASALLLA